MSEPREPGVRQADADYHERSEHIRALPLEEVEGLIDEITRTLAAAKEHYPTAGEEALDIDADDMHCLEDAFGVLLPLGLNGAVQEQIKNMAPDIDIESLAFSRIGSLSMDLMVFMAGFDNTPIHLVE